ncbi:hypothetical protein GOP47_0027818 [Adiantum capillus-veneris]|nr:hypothetical protein GOP47_0027818 [Adiantum capillus-veneris]
MDAIERSIKQHTDRLLDVFHSVNERLFQLETTVQGLHQTIAGLQSIEGEKQDQSNSRLTKLELVLEEVRRGVQFLHEKQSMEGVNSHMANLRVDGQKPAVGGLPQTPAEGWQQPKTAKEEAPQVAFSESPPQLPQHMPSQYPAPTQAHYPPPPPLPQIQAYTTQSMVPLPSTTNAPPAANQQPYPPAVQHIPPQ